jgi:glucosamine-6-phosphate deaminase
VEEILTPLQVLPTPDAIGAYVAQRVLGDIARKSRERFLLGCPTGRTPRPIYAALAQSGCEMSNVVLVMMDEYLIDGQYAPATEPWSCHNFVRQHVGLNVAEVWFPDPNDPAAYDARIADAGGIDLFLLASGASDGHVAFNAPGSLRESRTRIVPLSETTRRDNLQTSPSFRTLQNVPRYGVTVGIDTIASARAAIMIVWGASKRLTLTRMVAAQRYDSSWPATVIHECAGREIVGDTAAAAN